MSAWQPISTAEVRAYEQNPHVLCFQPEVGVFIARYEPDNDGGYEWFLLDSVAISSPTHWMPLPAPPKESVR